jgi:ribosomal protection tetracycline resistance protein
LTGQPSALAWASIERVAGAGQAFELLGADPNPFLATVGRRIEPAPIGSGVCFDLEVELGSMPLAFIRAVEISLREALRQGLHGWEVTDCAVAI